MENNVYESKSESGMESPLAKRKEQLMNVYFFEAFEEEREALVRFGAEKLDAGFTWKTIQEAGMTEPPAPIISVRTQSVIPTAWAGKIKGILTRSTGYDHLVRYRQAVAMPELPCGYLPLYCNRTVAEQALTLWMALARKLPVQTRQFDTFNRDGLTGREIAGKRLLVVGVGRIGSQIVSIGRGLQMDVKGVDPVHNLADLDYVDFAAGAPWADIVAVAMKLTPENTGFFTPERLALMKRGALLVNVARGEFTPLAALAEAVKSGQLGGVGLDVYEAETKLGPQLRGQGGEGEGTPLAYLRQADNVILTPHNAFNTYEAVQRKSEQSVHQVEAFLRDGRFVWPIE